ncbi:conjugal transfer protein [Stenotrophomonas maltophilia]|uniref:Conjugal transfer protein n=1 Tax=Stenotrophomonas maltophilia TaxID=40324 RepID=A0AA40YCM9_STEMA|nr:MULTISPECIES: TraX family protein [Stenotrophomonas]MBH1583411.1 conjugal transfer protein [Stenotrophomonas maltophilia]MBH1789315.1 conjugal transfer protein [Stenotrophomonas maltophilia]MCR1818608.1 TraX family protein [Stenotrophomonas muris]MDG9973109.1 TraX family protein [Stenotrophomonas sp. GD04032]OWQ70208.1 conjugal transfer protein [Stenotrophomonas maltophilia]
MTSSAREVLKWLAVVLMTCDHVAKIIYGGYVPGLSEAGRVAFPLFALVMAYNLAQPGADPVKSVRRLGMWGLIAQPVHAFAFGYWLPLNILLTFALCAAAIYAAGQRKLVVLAFAAAVLPAFVDYQWSGVGFVLLAWLAFHRQQYWLLVPAFAAICWFNGNLWALASIPVALSLSRVAWPVLRGRWAFYGYYVGHLACLGLVALILPP